MQTKRIFFLAASSCFFFLINVAKGQSFSKAILTEAVTRPWEMVYGPDNMLWITQLGGKVSRVHPNTGVVSDVYTAPDYLAADPSRQVTLLCGNYQITSGTYGMALHPLFATNPYVYFIYSYNKGTSQTPVAGFKVRRLTWDATAQSVTSVTDVITDLPLDLSHEGLRMIIVNEEGSYHFYITTGDGTIDNDGCYPAGNNENLRAQDWDSRFGKTLRYNLNGSIPASNPIANSPVFTIGHRNALGLAYNSEKQILYSSENGKRSDDEINIIEKAKNYGWPKARGYHTDNNYPTEQAFVSGYVPSLVPGDALKEAMYAWCTTPVTFPEDSYKSECIVAPSDMLYYSGSGVPAFNNCLLVTTIKNFDGAHASVNVFKLNSAGTGLAVAQPAIFFQDLTGLRYRDITLSPDGKTIFVCTDAFSGGTNKIFKFTYLEVNLSVSASAGTEAGTTLITITATATGPVSENQTLNLSVAGAGINAGDYSLSNSTITIPNGQTTGTATFSILNDDDVEGTETASITINNPSNGIAIGDVAVTSIVIYDNEVANFYVRTAATDLSQPGNWTSDINGIAGNVPANFSSSNQSFNINRNPIVAGSWAISQGSKVYLLTDNLIFSPTSKLTVGTSSTFDFGGNNQYNTVFKSDATSTFSLAKVDGTITNANNITVERYITAKAARKNVFVASPVSQLLSEAWQKQIHITGQGSGGTPCNTNLAANQPLQHSNGFDATQTNNPSFFTYTPGNATGFRWTSVSSTNATSLTPGKGYRAIVRGGRDQGCSVLYTSPQAPTALTLSAKGTLTQGDVAATIIGIQGGGDGFNLLGNPYPCPIDFDNGQWEAIRTANSIDNAYYTYNPANPGGTYSVYSAGIMTNASGVANPKIIASGQAFFVHKNNNGDVNVANFFQENFKSSTPQAGLFRESALNIKGLVRIKLVNNDGEHLDETIVRFAQEVNNSKNEMNAFDALSINEGSQVISTLKGTGNTLAIQTRPSVFDIDTVKMRLVSATQGTFKLIFSEFENYPLSVIYLKDKYAGLEQQITTNNNYSFSINADSASQGSDRFQLIFYTKNVLPVTFLNLNASHGNNGIALEWKVSGEVNMAGYILERSSNGTEFYEIASIKAKGNSPAEITYSFIDARPLYGSNYYRVKSINLSSTNSYTAVVKSIWNDDLKSRMSIYPNPVKKILNITVSGVTNKIFALRILDSKGAVMLVQKQVLTNTNKVAINIGFLRSGFYLLEATTNDGHRSLASFIKQ